MARRAQDDTDRAVDAAFGSVLLELRKERGLSQEALGLESGFGRIYISELERGRKGCTLKTLFRLAEHLDVSVVEIAAAVHRRLEAAGTNSRAHRGLRHEVRRAERGS